jgi:hypothetical protein
MQKKIPNKEKRSEEPGFSMLGKSDRNIFARSKPDGVGVPLEP